MALIGSFALLLALALSAYSFIAGFFALLFPGWGSDRLGETARRAGVAVFGAVLLAAAALVIAAFANDFSIAYIFQHSNRELPGPYKFATLWSGQEGSLLFWSLLLAAYGLVLRLRHKTDSRLFAYASVIIAAVQVFFLLLLNIPARPFGLTQGPLPADGSGLNPLLQYPEMVIHPPMLYLGYVGFTVPFAFALGALAMKYPGEKWIHITRRWTMVTWGFLTIGVFLGMHWAYSVLGWGGYWGWDPVESASFMPWLTGTAFLHSVMMQEKRGMLKVWNVWLIFATFMLSVLGTSLTRSGVVSSVHAFAQSSIGTWFWAFLSTIIATCLFFYLKNKSHLRTEHRLESLVSRESSFLFNNLLFVLLCFTVLWGTLFPILSEWVQGKKISVGPPFFNKVALPVTVLLLLLTAVGPLLAWRRTSLESMRRNFLWPAIGALIVGATLISFGHREWRDLSYLYVVAVLFLVSVVGASLSWSKGVPNGLSRLLWLTIAALSIVAGLAALRYRPVQDISYLYSLVTIVLSALVIFTVISEFYRGGRVIHRQTGNNLLTSMAMLLHRNTRRYGGYIVHFGVVVVMIGFAGTAFNQDKEQEMAYGDKMTLGSWTLLCRSYTQEDKPNYGSEWAIIDVFKNGKQVDTLYPERRFYKASQQMSTLPQIRRSAVEDLYLIYEGINQDTGRPIIKAHLNPLVMWIWIGAWIMIAGTIVALIPSSVPVRFAVTQRIEEPATVGVGD